MIKLTLEIKETEENKVNVSLKVPKTMKDATESEQEVAKIVTEKVNEKLNNLAD